MTTQKSDKKIDYLDEDPAIRGQEWICVSFLSPEGVKNCNIRGFKFRGAFGTRLEAEAHAKQIQEKLDPDFHIYVGEGFKWLPWDQDPETVENQEYHEKELNELMKASKENLLLKKQHENERKKQKMQEAMTGNDTLKKKNVVKERLQKKLMKKRKEKVDEKETVEQTPDDLKENIEQLSVDEKKLEAEKKDVVELNNGLQKLQEVYAKLLEKNKK
jgi:DNA repair exonuclease SbcCD ATPase subunit